MQTAGDVFEFTTYKVSENRSSIIFSYQYVQDKNTSTYKEELQLPIPIPKDIPERILNDFLFPLHLMLGVSFYKMYCPRTIHVRSGILSRSQAKFWNTVYTKGLGEFFYRNKIDFRGLVNFPYTSDSPNIDPISYRLSHKSLLGIGGGKDSLVSYELLRKAKRGIVPFVIETNRPSELLKNLLTQLSFPQITVRRVIKLDCFNSPSIKPMLDGHIPISAVNAFIGIFACLIYGYKYFIVSNEKSASIGNVNYFGMEINHQWSKSIEFELMFQSYIRKYVSPNIVYFSLLRPLSEFAIAQEFSKLNKYFSLFSSCNKNFSIGNRESDNKWCGTCPKCVFVFCLLSAFLPKKTLMKIFGQNLYDRKNLLPLFRELWGAEGIKPFECVGTSDEVMYALFLASQKREYDSDAIIQTFKAEVFPLISDIRVLRGRIFSGGVFNTIPPPFKKVIPTSLYENC